MIDGAATIFSIIFKKALGYANVIVPGSIFSYHIMLKRMRENHLDSAGIEPSSPAQHTSTLTITPSPLDYLAVVGMSLDLSKTFGTGCLTSKLFYLSQTLAEHTIARGD